MLDSAGSTLVEWGRQQQQQQHDCDKKDGDDNDEEDSNNEVGDSDVTDDDNMIMVVNLHTEELTNFINGDRFMLVLMYVIMDFQSIQ